MAEEIQKLFATPADGEEAWELVVESKLGPLSLPMCQSQIVQEIKDQSEIKATHRKAILRTTQKAIVRGGKMGLDRLSAQDIEQLKWNHFIVLVDRVIDGRHQALRDDPGVAETFAKDPAFRPS